MANNGKSTGIDTLIGVGMQVTGDILCQGTLRVQGTILGNVHCDRGEADALVVDPTGAVTGEVHAANVDVRGRVTGPVHSMRQVEVHEGGIVLGDISFRTMAMHPGGIAEGLLIPSLEPEHALAENGGALALPAEPAGERRMAAWKSIAAGLLAIGVASGAWIALGTDRDAQLAIASPAAASAVDAARPALPLPEDSRPPANDAPPPLKDAAQLASAPPPEVRPRVSEGNLVTVQGANPERPTGVFLLISNEEAFLHKKKLDEPGDGTRTGIAAGERASISITADEIIRISKGRDVTIYFQGQKVPRRAIENETWIRFVPK